MDYKEKYEQALERARVYHTGGSICDAHMTEVIFPELKESEGEKIRKALIEMIHDTTGDECEDCYHVSKESVLAWLEKQSKTLDAYKVIARLVANICDFEYYVKQFKKDLDL
jgi:hypothetical protein